MPLRSSSGDVTKGRPPLRAPAPAHCATVNPPTDTVGGRARRHQPLSNRRISDAGRNRAVPPSTGQLPAGWPGRGGDGAALRRWGRLGLRRPGGLTFADPVGFILGHQALAVRLDLGGPAGGGHQHLEGRRAQCLLPLVGLLGQPRAAQSGHAGQRGRDRPVAVAVPGDGAPGDGAGPGPSRPAGLGRTGARPAAARVTACDGAGATGSGARSRVTAAKAAPAVAVAATAPIQATAPVRSRRRRGRCGTAGAGCGPGGPERGQRGLLAGQLARADGPGRRGEQRGDRLGRGHVRGGQVRRG